MKPVPLPNRQPDWEAILRGRLLPCQLDDIAKTGSFCVRGGDNGRLWRIYVEPPTDVHQTQVVINYTGRVHNAWWIDGEWTEHVAEHFDNGLIICGWEAAFAFYIQITTDAYRVVAEACTCIRPFTMLRTTSYGGKI
jgi:hypothetical protein